MVVSARYPDDEVGVEDIEGTGEGAEELFEIHVALNVADGFDIHGAIDAAGGGSGLADVDGVGEDAGIVFQQAVGAVALVGIGIDDHDADAGLFFLEVADGDGDVVENTESFAASFESVVGSAGEADGYAFGEGRVAGLSGGFGLGGAAGEEARIGGEA